MPHPALDTMGSSDSEIACLQYIHSQGVALRDLEPEVRRLGWMFSLDSSDTDLIPQNVLLTKDDPPAVKVADFGPRLWSIVSQRSGCVLLSVLFVRIASPDER